MTAAHVTLCFLLRNDAEGEHVLLGTKKTGFGSGKVVGVGGHVEPGETAVEAAVREVMEEINVVVRVADLVQAGTVDFIFPARPEWNMATTVYLTRTWIGEPSESDEIAPDWYPVARLPVERMWADAEHWLPAMIAGQRIAVQVDLAPDNQSVASVYTVAWSGS
ncbi:NUDIX domain-containing protein [Paenarthrobacter sp. AT5]|uniref:8-oxo-dGTP diphosphatase n=1 Tax=Paenarthrobacter TaxID=1742992 RepID=UPI001A99CDB2|nr:MULTISPECIES: NUDIX domain-containing protein [Paenarthrobacter]QSZ54522.1 NUDIX hydrolase [Paenarthrobacter ureafaciens]WOC62458.1 NUDIX domain-containing protein [Paenarthrobacter sp. AT5]